MGVYLGQAEAIIDQLSRIDPTAEKVNMQGAQFAALLGIATALVGIAEELERLGNQLDRVTVSLGEYDNRKAAILTTTTVTE